MNSHSIHPTALVTSLWTNRRLIRTLVKREVLGRYRGSVLGIFWSFFHPLLMLGVYSFVFGEIFKSRFADNSHSRIEFTLLLFAGLLIFNLFAECINKAPTLILNHANFVKKVVFPLEILPWVAIGSALFHTIISLCVWILAHAFLLGWPQPTILLLPFILVPFSCLLVGISWMLASLGVYLRDINQVVTLGVSSLMFISPIFYPVASLPENIRTILYANPLTPVIEWTRQVMYWGEIPDLSGILMFTFACGSICWIGFFWFQKTRKGFADVV